MFRIELAYFHVVYGKNIMADVCYYRLGSAQLLLGHPPKDVMPNILSTLDNNSYHIVIPDNHQLFPATGRILNFSYYSMGEVWNNKLVEQYS